MPRQSYAIIGAGALGGLYGGLLAKAGFDVHFLLHRDYEHVRRHGWKVETVLGDFHLPQINAYADPEDLPACDVTILGLKATRNDQLRRLLPPPTRDGGVVLVLQNGLNVEADSVAVVGPDRVLGGCCFLCCNKAGPGHIRHIDYGRVVFGEYDSREQTVTPRVRRICDELIAAGIDAHTTDDLWSTRWRKLMWNIPFNGLSVTLDASTKELVDQPESLALAESIAREVHRAAIGCGAEIPDKAIRTTIESTQQMVPYDSSMRLDFLHRRPMEIEAIFGNPLAAAAVHGVEMPRVEMLARELRFIDWRNRHAPAATSADPSGD